MTSELAMEDVARLRAEGVEVTDRDVIRLNAYALKIEASPFCSEWYAMPRAAFLGDVCLREPAVGAILWVREAGRRLDLSDAETFALVWAYALSREPDRLPDPNGRFVETRLRWFALRHLSRFTPRQLSAALAYAIDGNLSTDGEEPPAANREPSAFAKATAGRPAADRETSVALGVLHDGVKYRVGTLDDLKRMTQSEIIGIVDAIRRREGGVSDSDREANARGEYFAVLEEIRNRGRATA